MFLGRRFKAEKGSSPLSSGQKQEEVCCGQGSSDSVKQSVLNPAYLGQSGRVGYRDEGGGLAPETSGQELPGLGM